jgi:hypothetical protein
VPFPKRKTSVRIKQYLSTFLGMPELPDTATGLKREPGWHTFRHSSRRRRYSGHEETVTSQ